MRGRVGGVIGDGSPAIFSLQEVYAATVKRYSLVPAMGDSIYYTPQWPVIDVELGGVTDDINANVGPDQGGLSVTTINPAYQYASYYSSPFFEFNWALQYSTDSGATWVNAGPTGTSYASGQADSFYAPLPPVTLADDGKQFRAFVDLGLGRTRTSPVRTLRVS